MIDLTNFEHRRGIVILTSKDMRVVSNNLFNWKVHTGYMENYSRILRSKVEKLDLSDSDRSDMIHYLDRIDKWIKDSSEDIDKAREIFR